ncbi:MAG: GAF domain-containing protein [Blastocatellia bacterium]|nr:GAF domain-containing protein [Blastocatellia bacterium]
MRDNPAIREAMWRGEPVGFDDLQSEAAFKNIEDFVKSHSICSVLYNLVTLQNDTQVFLCLDQCDKTRVWTQEEKALLVTISHELSIALEQAELVAQLQSQAEREAILNRITTAIRRSLDLQQILQTTVEELGKILSVDHCFIGLVGTTSTKIVVENEFCTSGVKSMKQKVIDKDMFEKNQTLLDTGKFLSLRPLAFEKETTNELVSTAYVPVRSDRGLIGVIGVGQASFERHWTKQEIGFIQGVANQVAVAVSQAGLLEQTKIQAEREALLNRIFKIMSESFDQEEILQKVVAKVGEAFNVSRCIVSLYDNQLERWMDVAEEYLAESVDSMKGKWNLIATPAQWVYKNQHIFVINNLDAYPLSEGKENLRSLKIGSMVMLPLIHVGEILGLLLLQQTGNERVWKDAELELLRSIASQLAVTIHNAHLFLKVNASQNQWQHTFESMTDGVALLLAPDKIVKANHSLLRICNCSSWQEFEKCDYLTLLGLRSFGEDYNPFEEVFNGAITIQFEVKALENRILRHNIDPIIDDRKGVSGAVLVVRDVTKERMAEQEMAQRNRELSVLNSISEEITKSLEIDQIISSAFNKTVEVMRADVGIVILLDDLQENLRPVAYYGEQKDKIFEILSRAQYRKGLLGGVSEKKETFVVEAISDTSIDPLFFQVASLLGLKSALFTNIQSKNRVLGLMMIAYSNSHCFNDQELQLVTAIGRQVGVAIENASLISSLQTALQKLREANRLKDEFLATLSHELRTPLTSITGWAEILSDRSDKDEEIESGLKAILSNSETLQQLINDLLELSRIENRVLKLELEPTNVNTIVDLAIQTVKQMADNRAIKIYREFAEELPDVTADGGRLQQVFWNLLSNSIKFSSRNSSVYVKTSFLDGVVEVKVKDNGIGIEPHFLPFVFERFRQADSSSTRRYGGLGIGLSLVKSLVEVHGGEVWAESEGKDQGSTFTVRLPVQNPSQLPADTVEELSYKEKVLIIEDLEDNLRLLSSIVEKQGYDVLTARSTEVGLRMAEHTPPKMIIFDVNMPGRNPIEVIQQVKKHTELAKVPVLAVSSFVLESERQQILNAGFDGLVTKPFRRSELVSLMQELISAQ